MHHDDGMHERRNWALGSSGGGADPEETTGYEGSGYGSDFDFEGAGGFEDRGGSARGGGPDLAADFRDSPAHYGRELLDWDTLGNDARGRGMDARREREDRRDFAPHARDEGSGRIRGFRGVGPKGWSRSDELIREDVCEALHDAEVDVSAVSVDVSDGLVELTGTIEGRFAKRYVEDVAYAVRGVRDVRNRIELV